MGKPLDHDDSIALLKHYEISVHEGHRAESGRSIVFSGAAKNGGDATISITIGDHTANRQCPVTEFLAEGLVTELKDPHLKADSQAGKTIAHLAVKASKMLVDSSLESFNLTALLEGDHYEVLSKGLTVEATSATKIPHRLTPTPTTPPRIPATRPLSPRAPSRGHHR